jgi:hypothetical protein
MSQSLDALSVQPPWVNCDDGIGKFDQFYPRSFLSDENRNKLRTEVGVEAVFVGYFAAWRYYPSPSFLGDRNKKMASSYLAVLLLDVDSRDLIWGCNISNGGMVRSYPRYIEVPIGRALRFFEKDLKKAGITLR